MIADINKIRSFITTDISDDVLVEKMSAIESSIRSYTNNNFQIPKFVDDRCYSHDGNVYGVATEFYKVGDTIEINHSTFCDGLYSVTEVGEFLIKVSPSIPYAENNFIVHKVSYPNDVVMGALNLLKWEVSNREKVGVKSETISRWSVTYFDMDTNSVMGYPSSLLGFLKPYRKARC